MRAVPGALPSAAALALSLAALAADGPSLPGSLLDGGLAVLLAWLLTRSFGAERQRAAADRENVRALGELKESASKLVHGVQVEVAELRGQVEQLTLRLEVQRRAIDEAVKERTEIGERERVSRHELANRVAEVTGALDERLRETEKAIEALRPRRDR